MAKKGVKQSPEHIAARKAARIRNNGGQYLKPGEAEKMVAARGPRTAEHSQKIAQARRESGRDSGWKHSPESRQRISEAVKQHWADGVHKDRKPATKRAVSKMELALTPFLHRMGYKHSSEFSPQFFVPCGERGRVPDFVDRECRRVFEFFGNFWHHPDDEQLCIQQYQEAGWECTVLWEFDAQEWIEAHAHLVGQEYVDSIRETFRVRSAHPVKGNTDIGRNNV